MPSQGLARCLAILALTLAAPRVQAADIAGSYLVHVFNQLHFEGGSYCFTLTASNPDPGVTSGTWTAGANTGGGYTITWPRRLHLFGAWSGQYTDFTALIDPSGKLTAASYVIASVSNSLPLAVGTFSATRRPAC